MKNDLIIKVKNCIFGSEDSKFLGHTVNKNGIHPLPTKIKCIDNFPRPKSVEEFDALKALKGKPKPKKREWSEEMKKHSNH